MRLRYDQNFKNRPDLCEALASIKIASQLGWKQARIATWLSDHGYKNASGNPFSQVNISTTINRSIGKLDWSNPILSAAFDKVAKVFAEAGHALPIEPMSTEETAPVEEAKSSEVTESMEEIDEIQVAKNNPNLSDIVHLTMQASFANTAMDLSAELKGHDSRKILDFMMKAEDYLCQICETVLL